MVIANISMGFGKYPNVYLAHHYTLILVYFWTTSDYKIGVQYTVTSKKAVYSSYVLSLIHISEPTRPY